MPLNSKPALRAALHEALINAAGDGLVAIDRTSCIVVFNPAAGRIFGRDPASMVGQGLQVLFPPDKSEGHAKAVGDYFAGHGRNLVGSTLKAQGWHSSGRPVDIEISLTATLVEGEHLVLASIRDITARVKAEQHKQRLMDQLSQAAKMEALVTMAAGITHDFNKSLGTIETIASTLASELGSTHPHYETLNRILQAALQGSRLTENLLNFCNPVKEAIDLVSLNRVVSDSVALLRPVLSPRVMIRTELGERVNLRCNSGALQNAVMNIGLNAGDAMPQGGELFFSTTRVTLSGDAARLTGLDPGPYCLLVARDTGCGIPPEIISRVFDPFFTTKAKELGSGLGLATVYATVQSHKGAIIPESQVGQGTTFTIFLPASDDEPPSSRRTPLEALSPMSRGDLLLLVEDQQPLREMTEYLLRKLGFEVLTADCGEQAVERFTRHRGRVKLVMLDVLLPDISGLETFRRLRLVDPDVKVLVTSGFRKEDEPRELLLAGAVGFLKKPYGIVEVSQAIRTCLDGGR